MNTPVKKNMFKYVPDGKVIKEFFWDRSPVSIIQGPVGCLSAESEYLTRRGWRRIDEYRGEDIMVWRPDGSAWFERPKAFVDLPCDEMWWFHNGHSLSMMLSDEHRMPLVDRDGNFRVRLAGDVAAAPGRYTAPVMFSVAGGGFDEARLRVAIAIAADGCFPKAGNQVVIGLRKPWKKDRLRQLLGAAGIVWKEHQHSKRNTEVTFAFQREDWMSKVFAPWGASSSCCEVVLDEMPHWDGLYEGNEIRFSGTCKETAEFMQYAAHATGRRASLSVCSDRRGKDWKPLWTVQITGKDSPKSKVGIRGDHVSIDRVPTSDGRKYCFTTSTGFFIARHNGRVFVTGNSGTSTACCHKMWKISLEQKPDAAGVRRSRWLVVRNTYNDLKETTIKTWKYWFEEKAMGAFSELKMTNPPNHHIKWDMPDGTIVDAEFIFLALDNEEDVRKLLSLECTGVWFNEAQFTDKTIFDAAHGRAMQGRYPPKLDGGPTWKGVICDLNAPPEGHWIPYMRGDVPLPEDFDDDQRAEYARPDSWKFYVQPPGLIEVIKERKVVGYKENTPENRIEMGLDPTDAAENTKWLTEDYSELIKGKAKSYIDTYIMNRVGFYRSGKPVFESFRPEIHVAKEKIDPIPGLPLIVGLDFARNPAMVVIQVLRGAVYVLHEYGVINQAATTYAPLFKKRLFKHFPLWMTKDGPGIQFWGDPSGDSRGQGTDRTPYQIFSANGMSVVAAPGNNSISLRLNAVQSALDTMVDGGPGLLLNPSCITLKSGFVSGYHYAKVKGKNAHHDEPYKNTFADYHDALQYACLGAGLGFTALNPGGDKPKPRKIDRKRYSLKRGGRGR